MSRSPSSVPRLFAELKRRKVFRVMAVYGATAFVVLQVADLLAEGLGLPDAVFRLTTFVVLIGFPIAVVLAWAFETTPDGVKRTPDAAPEEIDEILAQPASRRWPAGLLALGGVILLLAGWWMGRSGSLPDLNFVTPSAEASDFRRIAVLPFEDLGGNAENDPLVAGLHVDIHGKLASLADLRVTSLGSVRDYSGSEKSATTIAGELAVDYLLRGSVRRAGDQARVNVQLTDVATREDIWTQEFDREVTAGNLFAIQSEIARRVADKLEATLSPADVQRLEAGLSTDNLEAINAYYRAYRSVYRGSYAGSDLESAIRDVEAAVEVAPEFVEGWALLAWLRSALARVIPEEGAPAREAVVRAEALAPGTLPAIKARGWYTYYVENDFQRALDLMLEAERLAPSDVDVLTGIAALQHRLGEFDEGVRAMKRAADLDPQNSGTVGVLGGMLMRTARWDAAREVLERALALDASNELARNQAVHLAAQQGEPGRALSLAAEFGLEADLWQVWYATIDRDYDLAARLLDDISPPKDDPLADLVRRDALAMSIWVVEQTGGDPRTVRDSLRALLQRGQWTSSGVLGALNMVEARLAAGQDSAGWALWRRAVDDIETSDDVGGSVGYRWLAARIASQFGRPEEAFPLLDEAVARPTISVWSVADLELDPRFDSMRDDPRFDALIARQRAFEAEQARIAEEQGPWLP